MSAYSRLVGRQVAVYYRQSAHAEAPGMVGVCVAVHDHDGLLQLRAALQQVDKMVAAAFNEKTSFTVYVPYDNVAAVVDMGGAGQCTT